jgi:hypothetical protein
LPAGESKTVRDRAGNVVTLGPLSEETYVVHDYLDYQDSSLTLSQRRADERLRKAISARAKELGLSVTDYRNTAGFREDFPPDSERKPAGFQRASGDPDPTRPDPTRPYSPRPPQSGGSGVSSNVASLKANPRALKTNPRAVGAALAADERAQRASLAIAGLVEPDDEHRGEWERLHTALIAAVNGIAEAYVTDFALVAVDGGTLVIGGPEAAWLWGTQRFGRPLTSVTESMGIPARFATADEFEGLRSTGEAA